MFHQQAVFVAQHSSRHPAPARTSSPELPREDEERDAPEQEDLLLDEMCEDIPCTD